MASTESLVEISDLQKEYKLGETTVHALRGVSLDIADGEFVAILGQSGSGKTTLLNMISALDTPTSGDVAVQGAVISSMKRDERTRFRRTSIGLVFQFYNLFPTLTALENVEIGIAMKIKDKEEMRKRASHYLELVGILDKANSYPSPTGNLDAETSEVIWNLLQSLNKQTGTTVIAVTHQTSVSKVADRSVFLRSGLIYGISAQNEGE
ncbi:MAG: ABC transporter ATP-binding protein [Candidatus Thorarchaeota archaeon]|jgi:putative ABC transport system ATP-binding protein